MQQQRRTTAGVEYVGAMDKMESKLLKLCDSVASGLGGSLPCPTGVTHGAYCRSAQAVLRGRDFFPVKDRTLRTMPN